VIPLRVLLFRRNTPAVTLILIAANVLCFLFEISLPSYLQNRFIEEYALVPDRLVLSSFVTSMFLHGGWLHLISNMWFLWVFGSHIEDTIGSGKYLMFYLVSGVASAIVQFILNLGSPIPTLGASGAIAGIMGGFLVVYPRARVVTLVILVIFITTFEVPAAFMLLYWFLVQFIEGLNAVSSLAGVQGYGSQTQGIAWFAHIGGFVAGALLIRVFSESRRYQYR
jgi:membrane associated rhomboid family serine protease